MKKRTLDAMGARKLSRVVVGVAALGCLALLVSPAEVADAQPGKGGKGKNADTVAPAEVSDLTVSPAALGALKITFTAVGDDGGPLGNCDGPTTAAAYDLRYSTSPINNAADCDAATQFTGEPDPDRCGFAEKFCIGGLQAGGTYYVALEVADEAGNSSGMPNVASAAAGNQLGDFVHVVNVLIQWNYWAKLRTRWTVVTIVDEGGVPVANATVTGRWTGDRPTSKSSSGVTDCLGRVVIDGSRIHCDGGVTIEFTVTGVTHATADYDSSANVETSGAVLCF